jgi:hypothetical protein
MLKCIDFDILSKNHDMMNRDIEVQKTSKLRGEV